MTSITALLRARHVVAKVPNLRPTNQNSLSLAPGMTALLFAFDALPDLAGKLR
jgi:hypothetical protein